MAQMLGGPENQETPAIPGEEDLGGGLPKVISVDKYAMNDDGKTIDYDTFISAGVSEIFDSPELSVEEVLSYVQEHYATNLEDEIQSTMERFRHLDKNPEPVLDIDYLMSAIQEGNIGRTENTYNWSWWGPTVHFTILGPSEIEGEPYAECIILASTHNGGDVRGNYALPKAFKLMSYAEEAPWYAYRLYVNIKTDKGDLTLDASDDEAYHFYVGRDESGIFGEGESVSYDDLEKKLDWEEFGSRGIW